MNLPPLVERSFESFGDADPKEAMTPGEVIPFNDNRDPSRPVKIIICCPNCGRVASHINSYNRKTKTAHPSIVCGDDTEGCGWHGWLKNGVYSIA